MRRQPIPMEPGAAVQTPVIRTTGLGKTYSNGTTALRNIHLSVSSDQFVVILGSSGAGKSTLLRCLNRLITPSEGQVDLMGEDITAISGKGLRQVRRRVGMIFQQFHLMQRLTVLENVLAGRLRFNSTPLRYGLSLMRLFPKVEKDLAFDCLRQVGIAHLALQRADTLSGGQQQRVAIARTLAQQPQVFLADEPIASLDPHSAETVMGILQKINEVRKIPIIVNLHQLEFAKRYGRRVIGMANGQIVFDGEAGQLTRDLVQRIYGSSILTECPNREEWLACA
jgi:phosphonate transport system ATP-binding protein